MSREKFNQLSVLINKVNDIKTIVELALSAAGSGKIVGITTANNLALDIKDNWNEPFTLFASENGIRFYRSGLSQYFIIEDIKVKIKFHNSLNRHKRNVIKDSEMPQLKLFPETAIPDINLYDEEWELGIQTNKTRDALLYIRLSDFKNDSSHLLYAKGETKVIDFNNVLNKDNDIKFEKNNIRVKENISKAKTEEQNVDKELENGI